MSKAKSILRGLWSPQVLTVVVAMLALFVLNISDAVWIGHATIPLEFIVVDAKTNMPVSRSLVQLKEGQPEYAAPVMGKNGRTKLVIEAMCGGRSSIFGQTRSVHYGAWEVRIEADGYEPFRDVLSNLTRDRRYHEESAVPPPILIQLRKQTRKPKPTVGD